MQKSTVYFEEKLTSEMDAYVKVNNFKSRNEFLAKSARFYMDYNNNKEAGDFLAKEIQAIMSGNMELVEKRLGNRFSKLLSDIAIQLGIQQQIFKSISNITEEDTALFRKIAVDEMKNNQRIFKYEDLAK